MTRHITQLLLGILSFYQRRLSPLKPATCRFHPSCSEYARQSLEKKMLFTALKMIVLRVLKCHPFHQGGLDPVKG